MKTFANQTSCEPQIFAKHEIGRLQHGKNVYNIKYFIKITFHDPKRMFSKGHPLATTALSFFMSNPHEHMHLQQNIKKNKKIKKQESFTPYPSRSISFRGRHKECLSQETFASF